MSRLSKRHYGPPNGLSIQWILAKPSTFHTVSRLVGLPAHRLWSLDPSANPVVLLREVNVP